MSELYAGKIILKPTAMARLRIRDRYSLHRMVLDLYPCRETDGKGPFARGVQWADRGEHLAGREVQVFADGGTIDGLRTLARGMYPDLEL